MICQICQSIFNCDRSKGVKFLDKNFHIISFRGVQLAGRAGCALCAQLFHKLKAAFPGPDDEADGNYWLSKRRLNYRLVEHWERSDRFTLSFRLDQGDPGEADTRDLARAQSTEATFWQFEVASSQYLADYLTFDGIRHSISKSSDSDETWKLAKSWMTSCAEEHPECRPNKRPEKWYPTRLLDVGLEPPDFSADPTIRLHVPQQTTSGHYMTVSHRWGDRAPLKLTVESAPGLLDGVPVANLPQTFADAVKVAWKFQIRYLWIDSLCIFQDSKEEWRSESAKMGLVYKNSWLNIAAIDSADCHGGCFSERQRALVEPIRVKLGPDQQEYFCIDKDLWLGGLDGALLSKRGWFVQERLLSPRQIHFGSLQLYWECRRHAACETLPGGILPSMFAEPGTAASQQMKRFAATIARLGEGVRAPDLFQRFDMASFDTEGYNDLQKVTAMDIHTGWRHTTVNYTSCALTFPRDKLMAIAGVAKEMSKVTNDQYLAGLWRSHLPLMLLWKAQPSGRGTNIRNQTLPAHRDAKWCRSRPLRAPTWSWASIDTAVGFFYPMKQKEADNVAVGILEAHVEPLAGDIHGEILSGYLRVRCTLYPVTLHSSTGTSPLSHFLQIGSNQFHQGVFLDESPDTTGTGLNLHCMPVFFRDWYGTQKAPTQVRALLLQPTGKGKGHFERFGLFADWGNRDLEVFNFPWHSVSDLEFEEDLGNGQYVITIV